MPAIRIRLTGIALLTPLLTTLSGCGGVSALPVPDFDPAGAAAKAMELYDSNSDGAIAGDELEKAPGLRAAMKNLDTNGDGQVSEDEISARVQAWDNMQVGAMLFDCTVTLNGTPLSDATITLDPDEFLGDTLQPATSTTSMGGTARPRIPKDKRPTPTSPPGLQAGIYKVRISKMQNGKETIPAKYNTETILGQEVSLDDAAIKDNRVAYKLRTK